VKRQGIIDFVEHSSKAKKKEKGKVKGGGDEGYNNKIILFIY